MSVKVVVATRSPMNKKNWLLQLECGHEQWSLGRKVNSVPACDTCPRSPFAEAVSSANRAFIEHQSRNEFNDAERIKTRAGEKAFIAGYLARVKELP